MLRGTQVLLPPAHLVFEKFVEQAISSPHKQKRFLSLLKVFGITRYAEKSRRKMVSLAERGINPFDICGVPINFSGIYPEISFSILFEKSNDSIARRASKLVFAALKYRQSLMEGTLEKEIVDGKVIGNERSHNLFGRVVNLRKSGLNWVKDIKDCKNSAHIVVAINGEFFKLDVIDHNGTVIPIERILPDIEAIIRAAKETSQPSKRFGICATNIARSTSEIFYSSKLDESVKTIDEAIFLLAIDHNSFPADENEAARYLHMWNNHNRDYRKSLQLVVLQNEYSGVSFNLFAGIEGALARRFATWIHSFAGTIPHAVAAIKNDGFSKLEFETIDFDSFPLAKLKAKIAKFSCDLPLIKRIDVIGKVGIKQLNVSPDAFFHAAAHLAYYERFRKIPSMYNFADMRGIEFGSITRYLSTTSELAEFLKRPTKLALLRAFAAHKNNIAAVRTGENPMHYTYYYLFSHFGFRTLLAVALFRLFVPKFFTKHVSGDIWASNIAVYPGIFCLGRFGVYFKVARKNCLAGHYLLFPDHIKICFLSNEKTFLQAWHFDQALADAMSKLKQILSKTEADTF